MPNATLRDERISADPPTFVPHVPPLNVDKWVEHGYLCKTMLSFDVVVVRSSTI